MDKKKTEGEVSISQKVFLFLSLDGKSACGYVRHSIRIKRNQTKPSKSSRYFGNHAWGQALKR
jgi:hypothetical protein